MDYNWPWKKKTGVVQDNGLHDEEMEIGCFRGRVEWYTQHQKWVPRLDYVAPEGHDDAGIIYGSFNQMTDDIDAAKVAVEQAIIREYTLMDKAMASIRRS